MILSVAQINQIHTLLQEYDSATHVSIQADYVSFVDSCTQIAYFFKYTANAGPLLVGAVEITEQR